MKNLLIICFLLFSVNGFAQYVGSSITFFPFAASRAHKSDSTQIQFLATSNETISTVAITQTLGPTVAINAKTAYFGNSNTQTAYWVQGLQPGTYAWKATVKVPSGNTAFVVDTLNVVADPICPICPVCPAPRTVTSIQVNLFGIMVSVPLISAKLIYSDGSTQ